MGKRTRNDLKRKRGAFGQLLSEMDALGYGLAWRVLDAQFFGVATKRERVFLVGSLGNMSSSEALFESESMCWDSMESKQQRDRIRQATGRRAAQNIIVIDRAAYNQGINAKYTPHIERCDLMDTIVAKGPNAVAVFKQDSCEIRRLTPKEEERLNGFPDDWTLVPYKGKLASDNVRYKVLGNSMAVPVMRWIGQQIQSYIERQKMPNII